MVMAVLEKNKNEDNLNVSKLEALLNRHQHWRWGSSTQLWAKWQRKREYHYIRIHKKYTGTALTLLSSTSFISLNVMFCRARLVLHVKECNRSISKFLADWSMALWVDIHRDWWSRPLQAQQIFFLSVTSSLQQTLSSAGWLLSSFLALQEVVMEMGWCMENFSLPSLHVHCIIWYILKLTFLSLACSNL